MKRVITLIMVILFWLLSLVGCTQAPPAIDSSETTSGSTAGITTTTTTTSTTTTTTTTVPSQTLPTKPPVISDDPLADTYWQILNEDGTNGRALWFNEDASEIISATDHFGMYEKVDGQYYQSCYDAEGKHYYPSISLTVTLQGDSLTLVETRTDVFGEVTITEMKARRIPYEEGVALYPPPPELEPDVTAITLANTYWKELPGNGFGYGWTFRFTDNAEKFICDFFDMDVILYVKRPNRKYYVVIDQSGEEEQLDSKVDVTVEVAGDVLTITETNADGTKKQTQYTRVSGPSSGDRA